MEEGEGGGGGTEPLGREGVMGRKGCVFIL